MPREHTMMSENTAKCQWPQRMITNELASLNVQHSPVKHRAGAKRPQTRGANPQQLQQFKSAVTRFKSHHVTKYRLLLLRFSESPAPQKQEAWI